MGEARGRDCGAPAAGGAPGARTVLHTLLREQRSSTTTTTEDPHAQGGTRAGRLAHLAQGGQPGRTPHPLSFLLTQDMFLPVAPMRSFSLRRKTEGPEKIGGQLLVYAHVSVRSPCLETSLVYSTLQQRPCFHGQVEKGLTTVTRCLTDWFCARPAPLSFAGA